MAHIVKLVKGDNETISKNLKLFDDKDEANKYCDIVDEVLDQVNSTIEDVSEEWMVYREEFEVIYK
jgi:hypothetical protein